MLVKRHSDFQALSFFTVIFGHRQTRTIICDILWSRQHSTYHIPTNLKDIIDADMVPTTEGVTYNSPNVPLTSTPVKKPSARKSLRLFTNMLDV